MGSKAKKAVTATAHFLQVPFVFVWNLSVIAAGYSLAVLWFGIAWTWQKAKGTHTRVGRLIAESDARKRAKRTGMPWEVVKFPKHGYLAIVHNRQPGEDIEVVSIWKPEN